MKELQAIQQELKAKKSKYNKFGKYHYRSAEDILEALKPLLDDNGCTLIILEEVKEVGSYTFIESQAVLKNSEGDSSYSVGVAGIEKAGGMALPQAFGSASSYAKKYSLGNLFLIDDTADADATTGSDKAPIDDAKPSPHLMVFRKCKTMEELKAAHGKVKTAEWSKEVKDAFAHQKAQISKGE